jgi:carboxymethylenebutenolidase
MPQIQTEDVRLADGRALRLTHAEPDGVVRGGLVVLPEAAGVTDAVAEVVNGLAGEGWLVVVPHLPDALTEESALAATDIGFAWLAGRSVSGDRIGVVGVELGGSLALVVGARRGIGAVVTVAGVGILEPAVDGLPALVEIAGDLRVPWLGLYPSDSPSEEEVGKLRDAASAARVATDLVRYESGTSEAWQRALNWFDAHLR